MYRFSIYLALLLFGPAVGDASVRRSTLVELLNRSKNSVAMVLLPRNWGWEGAGSAAVIDDLGYLITSRHVVGTHTEVQAQLPAFAESLPATVVASDPRLDLAILRLKNPPALKALLLGPSSDIMVGEAILALGNPYGYRFSVSRGIVSATERSITMPAGVVLENLIQTDAAINPGNSGGPILNEIGEMIGVAVAIREGAQGIAFVIPSDTIKKFLLNNLSAINPSTFQDGITCKEEVIDEEGLERVQVTIQSVQRNTWAERVGFQIEDRVRRIGNITITNCFDLKRALWRIHPTRSLETIVDRDGTTTQFNF